MMNQWRLSDSETIELVKLRGDLSGFFKRRTTPEDFENLTTDTIITVGARFERRSTLRNFAYGVARFKLCDWYRRRKRDGYPVLVAFDEDEEEMSEAAPGPRLGLDTLVSFLARHEVLQRALAQLPDHYRAVVELWLLGHDNAQIAAALGINYNTARSRLVRGKAQLHEAFSVEAAHAG